jgi:hypothetical protein
VNRYWKPFLDVLISNRAGRRRPIFSAKAERQNIMHANFTTHCPRYIRRDAALCAWYCSYGQPRLNWCCGRGLPDAVDIRSGSLTHGDWSVSSCMKTAASTIPVVAHGHVTRSRTPNHLYVRRCCGDGGAALIHAESTGASPTTPSCPLHALPSTRPSPAEVRIQPPAAKFIGLVVASAPTAAS